MNISIEDAMATVRKTWPDAHFVEPTANESLAIKDEKLKFIVIGEGETQDDAWKAAARSIIENQSERFGFWISQLCCNQCGLCFGTRSFDFVCNIPFIEDPRSPISDFKELAKMAIEKGWVNTGAEGYISIYCSRCKIHPKFKKMQKEIDGSRNSLVEALAKSMKENL